MKQLLLGATIALMAGAAFATDVGVAVTIGEPGFYGRIVLGNVPQPRVIYTAPVIIEQRQVVRAPIYLRVPPGHEKHWDKHCRKYNACGQRVYFVQNDWYEQEYAPRYRTEQRDYRGRDNRDDRNDDQREQSYSERQLYEAALERLTREVAAVSGVDEAGAQRKVGDVLTSRAA